MHATFLLGSLLLAAVLGVIGAAALRWIPLGARRSFALVVLGLPVFVLALSTAHVVPWFWRTCATVAGWDCLATLGLLLTMWGTAAGAAAVTFVRLRAVRRMLHACRPLEDTDLLGRFDVLCRRFKLPVPDLRVLDTPSPVAVTGWLRKPTVVVSRWLLEHFDAEELEAVLAHELAHLARRTPQVLLLARLARDVTCYLPSAWYALQALEAEEELEADALAVEATRQPGAMASALGRVWQQALLPPGAVAALVGGFPHMLEERLTRLLENRARPGHPLPGTLLAGGATVAALLSIPQILATAAGLLPLYCWLGGPL
jgi:Zn-dependent protease with chaperone function